MIGILGGTFDPIHFGHLRVAVDVRDLLRLDEIRLIPCYQSPLRDRPAAGPEQRLAMVRMAIEGEPGLVVDDRELRKEQPSYTVDTLEDLRAELPSEPSCLLVGTDAFADFASWHRWEAILELAHLALVQRPGVALPEAGTLAGVLAERRTENVEDLLTALAGRIAVCEVTQLDISATAIRSLVAAGRSARYLLPAAVWEYIKRNRLYQWDR